MYSDEEKLDRHRKTWLTKECYQLIKKEMHKIKKEEDRKVSMQKIINNLILANLTK